MTAQKIKQLSKKTVRKLAPAKPKTSSAELCGVRCRNYKAFYKE